MSDHGRGSPPARLLLHRRAEPATHRAQLRLDGGRQEAAGVRERQGGVQHVVEQREVRDGAARHPEGEAVRRDPGPDGVLHQAGRVVPELGGRDVLLEQGQGVAGVGVGHDRRGVVGVVQLGQQVLAQERLGVHLPRGVQQQRHLQQRDLDLVGTRSSAGRAGVGVVGPGGRCAGAPRLPELEPDGLAARGLLDAPAGEQVEQSQPAAGPGELAVLPHDGAVRAAVRHLDTHTRAHDARRDLDGSAGVHQRVGHHLAGQQLGVAGELRAARVAHHVAHQVPREGDAGRVRRKIDRPPVRRHGTCLAEAAASCSQRVRRGSTRGGIKGTNR